MKKKIIIVPPEGKTLEQRCLLAGHMNVKHFKGQYLRVKPDCRDCDGYGEQAEKYGWECYSPK